MIRPVLSRRFLTLAVAVTAGAGIGVGTLSACSSGAAQPDRPAPAAATAPATAMPTTPSGPLTADQASAIAVQTSPGTVTDVEQDVEATGPVFDVKVQHPDGTETTVEVDATTGRVISTETDGADDPADRPGGPQ
jgi:hypothetical protein